MGTPYAHCPTCKSEQEVDFSLDESRTPYCCECGETEGLGEVEWTSEHDHDDYDDDHGPPDSDFGDSESNHVWADLARSEAE